MSLPVRNSKQLRLAAAGVIVCASAIAIGLASGLEHRSQFASMLLVDLVLGLGMSNRLRRELRKPRS